MKLYQIYFSPTGGTKKVLDIVGSQWDREKEDIDISKADKDFSVYSFQKEDICLVAVPSFGGRCPAAALSRIGQMTGGHALAALLVVYGNREYEDTMLELKDTLAASGFRCAAAVAAVAEHSIMRQYAAGRPDASDEAELTAFALEIRQKLEEGEIRQAVKVPGHRPYRKYRAIPFKPKADRSCTGCGLCVSLCPVQAIPAERPFSVEKNKCISCMRCVSQCPQHARDLNSVLLSLASRKMKKSCGGRKKNQLFL